MYPSLKSKSLPFYVLDESNYFSWMIDQFPCNAELPDDDVPLSTVQELYTANRNPSAEIPIQP